MEAQANRPNLPDDSLPPELADNPEYSDIVELGRGGMGVVYRARNTLMGRVEVLKVMGKDLMSKPGAAERFRREIQSAALLDHSNIVRAYTARQLGNLLVLAMEYVPGDELGTLVRSRGPLSVNLACLYVQQVAKGLQHAHEKGMVHRDIKPGNLIRLVSGRRHTIKILDFGLAKLTSESDLETGLTGAGKMLGTPDYIAPEQIQDARSADIRADIYSLGCTFYFFLTGNTPFRANSLYELLRQHQEDEPRQLNLVRPEIPAELAAVIGKMMAKKPGKRFQTPDEVSRVLAPFLKVGSAESPADNPPVQKPAESPRKKSPAASLPKPQDPETEYDTIPTSSTPANEVPKAKPPRRLTPPVPAQPAKEVQWSQIVAPKTKGRGQSRTVKLIRPASRDRKPPRRRRRIPQQLLLLLALALLAIAAVVITLKFLSYKADTIPSTEPRRHADNQSNQIPPGPKRELFESDRGQTSRG
jgi:serine/threonine protein kinase